MNLPLKNLNVPFLWQTLVIIALPFAILQTALAEPQGGTGLEVTSPYSLQVRIEPLSEKTVVIGLTERNLKARIELRLRRNGITPTDNRASDYLLYLNIGSTDNAFSFTLEFIRLTIYYVGDREYTISAPVWIMNGFGVYTDPREMRAAIVEMVLERVDSFSSEFLKVNTR